MGKYDCPEDEPEEQEEKEYQEHWDFMEVEGISIKWDTPQDLWDMALKYMKWCKDNPIVTRRKQLTGKNAGKDIVIEYVRPLTIKGLCLHCNITEDYITDVRNVKDKMNEYYIVITKILYTIFTQNAEGAMVGIYESGITSKMLNLEREEIPTGSVKVEHINELPELLDSENEILKKLEMENPEFARIEKEKS